MTRADLIAALEKLEGPFTMPLYSNQQRRDLIALAARAGLTERELDALDGALGGSLDAALTLVPEGWAWEVKSSYWTIDKRPAACVASPDGARRYALGATPALALCIAALKEPALALCIAALKAALPIDTERLLTDEDRAAIANDPFAACARLLEPDAKTRQRLFITLGDSREPTKTATQIKHEADVAALKARE